MADGIHGQLQPRGSQAACEGNANAEHLPAGCHGLQSPLKDAWLGYNVNPVLI